MFIFLFLLKWPKVTQEFEHFEGREIGQLWRFCDKSYRMLRNVASLRKCGDSERRIFLLMIPIFKENGLIWTLLDTSNIPNILLYSFDST